MDFHIVKMYKDKVVNKNVKNIFLSMCDAKVSLTFTSLKSYSLLQKPVIVYKGNNKITELRAILQRESQNS
jgi:hypothetical protein